jgi:endoglucanase
MKLWKRTTLGLLALAAIGGPLAQAAGKFTADDYKKALWMATRYYGGQRSGNGPNWLLMDHTYKTSFVRDADGTRDLTGGWFDCGDHVLFGQTFFYSAYMLAKAYDAFPTGFYDLYNGKTYADYQSKGDFSMAGGTPNGIPDILDEVKYATDWMIKATPDASTFYSQKGDGDLDHKQWVTAGKMSTLTKSEGGESDGPRSFVKNPQDGSMPGFAAATLAVMSRVYRKFDAAYADTCLAHAKFAIAYASGYKSSAVSAGSFYPANVNPVVGYVTGAAEVYKASGNAQYQSDAIGSANGLKNHYYTLCYANTDDLGYNAVGTLTTSTSSLSGMQTLVNSYKSSGTGENGLSTQGSEWGFIRYPANQAFSAALYSTAKNVTTYDDFIYNQVDYILGGNNVNQSFLVGFCSGCKIEAKHPHHRNVYLNDLNPINADKQAMPIPAHNKYFGAIVGGTKTSSAYSAQDVTTSYQYTEGGIDYNAGLVGALGYIVSKLAPAPVTGIETRSHASASDLQVVTNARGIALSLAETSLVSGEAFDLSGRQVATLSRNGQAIAWNTAGAAHGVYHMRVRTADGQGLTKTVVLR